MKGKSEKWSKKKKKKEIKVIVDDANLQSLKE